MTIYSGEQATRNYRDQLIIQQLMFRERTGMQMYRGPSPMQLAKQRWPDIVKGRTAKKCLTQLLDSDIIEQVGNEYRLLVDEGSIEHYGNNGAGNTNAP